MSSRSPGWREVPRPFRGGRSNWLTEGVIMLRSVFIALLSTVMLGGLVIAQPPKGDSSDGKEVVWVWENPDREWLGHGMRTEMRLSRPIQKWPTIPRASLFNFGLRQPQSRWRRCWHVSTEKRFRNGVWSPVCTMSRLTRLRLTLPSRPCASNLDRDGRLSLPNRTSLATLVQPQTTPITGCFGG